MRQVFNIFFFIMPYSIFSQNLKEFEPIAIRKIETNFTKEFIEKFNSEESIRLCEVIYKKIEDENSSYDDLDKDDLEKLKYCDDFRTNPWQKQFTGCSWYCGGRIKSIVASNVSDTLIHDNDYGTAWIGNSDTSGKEKITYTFNPESAYVTDIVIVNGYVRTDSLYNNYSRVKKIKLFYNNKQIGILKLLDIKEEQVFRVPTMGNTNRKNIEKLKKMNPWQITFEIEEIYQGNINNVALSELYFDGDGGSHSEE